MLVYATVLIALVASTGAVRVTANTAAARVSGGAFSWTGVYSCIDWWPIRNGDAGDHRIDQVGMLCEISQLDGNKQWVAYANVTLEPSYETGNGTIQLYKSGRPLPGVLADFEFASDDAANNAWIGSIQGGSYGGYHLRSSQIRCERSP